MKILLIPLGFIMLFAGCSTAIKTTSAAKQNLALHKTIAILPFEVRFDLRQKNDKKFSEEDMGKLKQFMALGLQNHLYHWLKSYSAKKPFTVSIQDAEITNTILSENRIRFIDAYTMSRIDLANLLKVDAVLTPQVIFAQPNSEAASVAFAVIGMGTIGPGVFGGLATQEMKMQILLNDNISDTALWTFNTKTKSDETTRHSKAKQKENILYPLFRNIDESLIKFVKNFPYRRSNI
ncbi:MAG TPA: hypothetical protein VK489_12425 [Ferruginibacter sp.]|nr:hypothetical protein [Ferruginibacter sp.]